MSQMMVANTQTKTGRSVLESKAISGIKTLGSDKTSFRTWHEKLVNAMSQVIPGSREAFTWIVRKANEDEIEKITEENWGNMGLRAKAGD